MTAAKTGLECFIIEKSTAYAWARLGYPGNQRPLRAGLCSRPETALDTALPGAVKKLFGPQQGWAGKKQDNIIESGHGRDAAGRPVYSLYGETRRPTAEMLKNLDAALIDLIDVGARVYTFAHTLSHFLEKIAGSDLKIILLDQPNPIGGLEVEGNILADDCRSFVGLHPVPMRHGLTLGELALFIKSGQSENSQSLRLVAGDVFSADRPPLGSPLSKPA